MLKILTILLMLPATAHAAAISVGEWESRDAPEWIRVQFSGFNFHLWKGSELRFIDCQIVEWPLNSPVAKGKCVDDTVHQIEIGKDSVIFDGYKLHQVFEE